MELPATLARRLRESHWRFVVTGSSGWIGMATLDLLHTAIGERASQRVFAFGSDARNLVLRDGSLVQQRPLAALAELPSGPTMLLHYAFLTRDRVGDMNLQDYVKQNRAISESVERFARRSDVDAVLALSSGAVYARDGSLERDLQSNPYGMLKLEEEARFTRWAEERDATLVLPRLFNLSGPYINKLDIYALATLIRAAQASEPMRIRAAHAVVRSYTAVEDLLAVCLWRLAQGARNVVRFDTAGEREIEIGELALEVKLALGSEAPIERPPFDDTRVDRYVGDGAAYAALLNEAGIMRQPLQQQIARTADDLKRRPKPTFSMSTPCATPETAVGRLLPRKRHPYYIVAPNYTQASAGIKALHMLCHALNHSGETAYLVIQPFYPRPEQATHPYLLTPLLDAARLQRHFEDGVCPITLYPETIRGNPFGAPLVARYLLNFPGLLGGDATFPSEELCIAYSERIAQESPNVVLTLFLPTSDPALFTPEPTQPRAGSCFYAAKYQEVHGGELFETTRNSVEITRLRPDSQTQEQIADLFRRCELFYCYENSALIIEALLCGCPVVMLPNQFLERSIGENEVGWDGIAWGTGAAEIARAKATVGRARANYLACFSRFEVQLRQFITLTQQRAITTGYHSPIQVPHLLHPGRITRLAATWELAQSMMRTRGIGTTLRNIVSRLRRQGFTLP